MKKALSLLLALVLCLSLCACGGEASMPVKDAVVGSWEYNHKTTQNSINGRAGDMFRETIILYKGGTGTYRNENITRGTCHGNGTLTWEVKDGVLNVTLLTGIEDRVMGFTYDVSTNTLTSMDGNVYTRAE